MLLPFEEGENAATLVLAIRSFDDLLLKLFHCLNDSAQNGPFESGLSRLLLPGLTRLGQSLEGTFQVLLLKELVLFMEDRKDPGIEGV